MNKYKKLLEEYHTLEDNYNIAIQDRQHYLTRNKELQNQIAELQAELLDSKRFNNKVIDAINTNKVNADVIQFLTAKKFGDDSNIEFAAIKTYRGWVTMYLNGREINPNGKDVTIWGDINEPIRVEVSGS